MEKYFLKIAGINHAKVEVTKNEFIRAERKAGFFPKINPGDPEYMNTCATGGFGCGLIEGLVEYHD